MDAGWSEVEATLTWDTGRPGQERMLVVAGPTFWADREHPPRYADAEGASPVTLVLQAGVRHPTATVNDLPEAAGGDVLRLRALPLGVAERPAGTTYLGLGASLDHGFTLTVEVRAAE